MSDLIDRQAAIDALRAMQTYKLFAGDDMLLIDQTGAQTELMLLPSAQPMRKEAKWKTVYFGHESIGHRPRILYCSRCNQCAAYPTDFCPACGADMRRMI